MKLNPKELGTPILGTGWSTTTKKNGNESVFVYNRSIEELDNFSRKAQARTLRTMGISTCVKKLSSGCPYWEVSDSQSVENLEKKLIECQVNLPLCRMQLYMKGKKENA